MNNQPHVPLHQSSTIYVAGHRGMVGSAIVRKLRSVGYDNIITRTHQELDLTCQQAVADFFGQQKIDAVILAAAKVGGIHANHSYPAEFIYKNLMIEANVIHQAFKASVEHLLFLGSSCIYPKFAPQPMKEEYLLSGALEPTNEPYAIAKIAGIKMCESYNRQYGSRYFSLMPTNLYGPQDNYHLENSHVLPALIRKCHLAKLAMHGDLEAIRLDQQLFGPIPGDIKEAIGLAADSASLVNRAPKVVIWGTGKARREFLHVDDMAAACVFAMGLGRTDFSLAGQDMQDKDEMRPCSFLNIGVGRDISIGEVAELVRQVVGFEGELIYNTDQPDGTPRKLLDTGRIEALGWQAKYSLRDGLLNAYQWYASQKRLKKVSH